MKGKKIRLFLLASAFLVACTDKDKDYYLSHSDKAEEKYEACEAELKEAFFQRDKDALEKLYSKDSECTYAKQAHMKHKKELREKQRRAEEAQIQAEVDQALSKLEEQYGAMPWQAYTSYFATSECGKQWFVKKTDYACKAMTALYEKKEQAGLTQLRKQGFDTLRTQKKKYCGRDARAKSPCDIWKKAVEEQGVEELEKLDFVDLLAKQEAICQSDWYAPACRAFEKVKNQKEAAVIKNYVDNYEQLKTDYNQCVDKYSKANWSQQAKISGSYPCRQTMRARAELRLDYDVFSKKMD